MTAALDWSPVQPLHVYADAVVSLDLTDFSETQTSVLGGVGYRIIPSLEINSGVRLGLSTASPDAVIQAGVAWQIGRLW